MLSNKVSNYKLFQKPNNEIENEEEEKESDEEMFFQKQYLDLDKLIQKTIKVVPKNAKSKSSNSTNPTNISTSKFTTSKMLTSINEIQDYEEDDEYNRFRNTMKPPQIDQNDETRSLESKPTGEFLVDFDDEYYDMVDSYSDDN